jgi:squalene-hopene/tetraprenyl-beta-curcumene cyclase
VQQPCGAWGETCASYDDRSLMGQGAPTASQTAWAVLGLIAAGRAEADAVRRGILYLQDTQRDDGGWDESAYTGTGFPRVFYLLYHLYRITFPLMALSRYKAATANSALDSTEAAMACPIPDGPRPFEI